MTTAERWTALVLAGQRSGPDPFTTAFQVELKALIPIAGESMVSRVVRTLISHPAIDRVVLAAQHPERLMAGDAAWMRDDPRIVPKDTGEGISASIADLAGGPDAPWPVLVTTADHPLLTVAMIDTMLAESRGSDLSIGMVERRTFLARFPDNKRTWLALRGGAWSGANLFAMRSDKVGHALRFWAEAERDRKRAIRLFLHFGPRLALRLVTRTIGMREGLARAGRSLGLDIGLVAMPQPEAAIDVDKPADHALAERILIERETA